MRNEMAEWQKVRYLAVRMGTLGLVLALVAVAILHDSILAAMGGSIVGWMACSWAHARGWFEPRGAEGPDQSGT